MGYARRVGDTSLTWVSGVKPVLGVHEVAGKAGHDAVFPHFHRESDLPPAPLPHRIEEIEVTAAVQEHVIDPERYAEINLKSGGHMNREAGMCLMEAVAFLAGEKHNDHPLCVSQTLGAFGRGLNDALDPELRQELIPLIPALIGTRGDGFDPARSFMAFDWLVRTWLGRWVDAAASQNSELRQIQSEFRALRPIADYDAVHNAVAVVNKTYGVMRGFALREGALRPGGVLSAIVIKSGYSTAVNSALHAVYMSNVSERSKDVFDTIGEAAVYAAEPLEKGLVPSVVKELQLSAIDLFAEMTKAPVLPA